MKSERLQIVPNFIIAGVPKSGTTFLFQLMRSHPDICGSTIKETRSFRRDKNGNILVDIEKYGKYFNHYNNEKIIMEASPGYLYGGKKYALKIKETLGDIKIIIILRDPVSRLFSSYKHKLRFVKNDNNYTFLEYAMNSEIRYKQEYCNYIPNWFEVFNDNLKIIYFEDLANKPESTLKMIFAWLVIDQHLIEKDKMDNPNQSMMYKNFLIHKFVLRMFKSLRPILPYDFRKTIRNIYYKLNGKPLKIILLDEDRLKISEQYSKQNRILKRILSERGYDSFPQWLK